MKPILDNSAIINQAEWHGYLNDNWNQLIVSIQELLGVIDENLSHQSEKSNLFVSFIRASILNDDPWYRCEMRNNDGWLDQHPFTIAWDIEIFQDYLCKRIFYSEKDINDSSCTHDYDIDKYRIKSAENLKVLMEQELFEKLILDSSIQHSFNCIKKLNFFLGEYYCTGKKINLS